jgi:glycosyltransferase involved in cell wall biosynthesis
MDDTSIKVAVIVPVFNTPSSFLQESINSIIGQEYNGLKLVIRLFIHDDGSTASETLDMLNNLEQSDSRYVNIYDKMGDSYAFKAIY